MPNPGCGSSLCKDLGSSETARTLNLTGPHRLLPVAGSSESPQPPPPPNPPPLRVFVDVAIQAARQAIQSARARQRQAEADELMVQQMFSDPVALQQRLDEFEFGFQQ